jgi:hypothetical protein
VNGVLAAQFSVLVNFDFNVGELPEAEDTQRA